jgi:DNA-binding beta-propeller fold protein YncE
MCGFKAERMRTLIGLAFLGLASAQSPEPLHLVATVPLPNVDGRIDHMAIDVKGQRLFVAALGNNTLEVVDIKNARQIHTISGLREPQGIAYTPNTNRIYVANSGDGSLRIFDAGSFQLLKTIPYGDDADNVRYDARENRIWVGYGGGALGVIDPEGAKLADIKLDAHPESFQLESDGSRIFVNLPRSRKIAVVDRKSGKVAGSWTTGGPQANYPMALDEANHRLFVVCRSPARMVVFDTSSGKVIATVPAVGDCDDVFYDPARKRIYATGGEGAISVFQQQDADHYNEIAKIATVKGARTGYFSPDLGRLFVAVRRSGSHVAEIRIYEAR